jgi:16S rRNA (cytosine1402-N4)-methyltransferase
MLADFGVSSHQLDVPGRGFSFRFAAPLDMRMDPGQGISAQELLADIDVDTLTGILRDLGEERYARRIARAIVQQPPKTTDALSALVRDCVPHKGPERIDPATRTFQALRMAVNDELGQIDALLGSLPHVLADHGLFVALSFHSLEDRPVKKAFVALSRTCTCPRLLPTCCCGQKPTLRLRPGKALRPQQSEMLANPRSRSTRLRAAYRLPRTAA